jgi:Protein of unknown function (DUF2845)
MHRDRKVVRRKVRGEDVSKAGSASKRGPQKSFLLIGLIGLVVGILCLSADPAYALRCGKRLVRVGDSTAKVLHICGEPESRDYRVVYHLLHEENSVEASLDPVFIPVILEEWVYDFGPKRFVQQLHFEDHILRNIQPLGYGD